MAFGMMPSTLEAALAYAARGWPILPIYPPAVGDDGELVCSCRRGAECGKNTAKHPIAELVPHGLNDATTDPDVIRSWFDRATDRYGGMNIAAPMRSGRERALVAFDAEEYNGTMDKLAALELEHGELSESVAQRSGSGQGYHLVYTAPADVDLRGELGGVTIRSRAYIVLAPSLHRSGLRYEWVDGRSPDDLDPAPLPEAWLAALRKPPASVGEVGLPDESEEHPRVRAIAPERRLDDWRAHLAAEAGEVAPDRATPETEPHRVRNGLAFTVACSLRRYAVRDPEAALAAMLEVYNPKCDPPYPDDKIARMVEKAYDYSHATWGAVYIGLRLEDVGKRARPLAPPSDVEVESHYRARVQRLSRSSSPGKQFAGELIKRALRGEIPAGEDERMQVAAALLDEAPAGATDGQLAVLIGSRPDDASAALAAVRAIAAAERAADADPNGVPADEHKLRPAEALAWMNERYTWVSSLGVPAQLDGERVELRKVSGWQLTLSNRRVRYEDETSPIAAWWLSHPQRRECTRLGMWAPPQIPPEGAHNLWSGFAIEPEPGDWSLLRDHVLDVIASGDAALAEYVARWLAWLFQNPGTPSEVALVLRGKEGVGKGTLGNALCRIFGTHASHVTNPTHFVGSKFNAHMRDCAFFFADECYWAGDRAHEGTLKGMITEPTLRIEPKGIDSYEVPNAMSILIASNNAWVVPAGADARRFVVADVSDARMNDFEHFGRLRAEMDSGGLAAMLHDLINTELGDWHPRQIVSTDALVEQKTETLAPIDRWTMTLLETGELPPLGMMSREAPPGWVEWSQLVEVAREFADRRMGDEKIRIALRRCGGDRTRFGKYRTCGWQFPPLAEARAAWCASHFVREWPKRDGWI